MPRYNEGQEAIYSSKKSSVNEGIANWKPTFSASVHVP